MGNRRAEFITPSSWSAINAALKWAPAATSESAGVSPGGEHRGISKRLWARIYSWLPRDLPDPSEGSNAIWIIPQLLGGVPNTSNASGAAGACRGMWVGRKERPALRPPSSRRPALHGNMDSKHRTQFPWHGWKVRVSSGISGLPTLRSSTVPAVKGAQMLQNPQSSGPHTKRSGVCHV